MEPFLRLPARPFADRADATDPVTVRTLASGDALLFYAVNRERYPIQVDIALGGARNPLRMSDDSPLPLRDGHLTLQLKPYELIGVRAERGAHIDAVRAEVPADEKRRIERQIAAVEHAGGMSRVERLLHVRASDPDFRLLQDAAGEARRAFAAGHYWRARTVLEHSAVLAVYKKLGCFPPGLLDVDPGATDCEE
jgi:hypothetical protein